MAGKFDVCSKQPRLRKFHLRRSWTLPVVSPELRTVSRALGTHPVGNSLSNKLSCRSAPYSGGRCSTLRQKSRASSSSAAADASGPPRGTAPSPADAPDLSAGARLCSLLASSLRKAGESATLLATRLGAADSCAHRNVFSVMEPSCTYTPRHAPLPPKACARKQRWQSERSRPPASTASPQPAPRRRARSAVWGAQSPTRRAPPPTAAAQKAPSLRAAARETCLPGRVSQRAPRTRSACPPILRLWARRRGRCARRCPAQRRRAARRASAHATRSARDVQGKGDAPWCAQGYAVRLSPAAAAIRSAVRCTEAVAALGKARRVCPA